MAYSDDRKLIERTKQSANALGVAANWVDSKRPVDMATDFVFELYVLFEFVIYLSNNYDVIYDPGVGPKKHKFPRKPAKKVGRPKFEIYSKNKSKKLCQLCSGTQIKDIVNMHRAPDISIQSANSSDVPTHKDVELIWDAKYRADDSSRITHSELSEFARIIDLLKVKNNVTIKLNLGKYQSLIANCLITNGLESTEPNQERVRLDLKEVANFFPGMSFTIFP